MAQERLTIAADSVRLAAVLHLPEGRPGPWPCVVTLHGLMSSKDSEKYVLVGEEFSSRGIAVCRFDFRGCGESQGAVAQTTVAQRVADTRVVVRRMREHPALNGRVALLGSSLGAYVALFAASEDLRVKAVAAWATPADLQDLAANPETVRWYDLGSPFVEELKTQQYLRAPVGVRYCLLVHGDQDALVPVDHAHRVYACALNPRRLEIIPGADHRLTDPAHRRRAVQASLEWIGRFV
jgi:alpha-beta hydrolase superfamily lysophospholipase